MYLTRGIVYKDIFNKLVDSNNHSKNFVGYTYGYVDNSKINIGVDPTKNVINIYYYVDVVGGRDTDGKDKADGIPDIFQVKFTYEVSQQGTGYITKANKLSEYEYVTKPKLADGKYNKDAKVNPVGKEIVANPAQGYALAYWIDSNNKKYLSLDEIRQASFLGNMTFRAVFEKVVVPPTPTPTPKPVPIPTPEYSPEPTPTVVPKPTVKPTVKPSATPTVTPTTVPSSPESTEEAVIVPITTPVPPTPPSNKTGGGLFNIDAEDMPFVGIFGNGASWALINLIATIIGFIFTLLLVFSKHKDEEEVDEQELEKNPELQPIVYYRKRIYKIVGVICTLIAIVVFILTENIFLPMVYVDRYTILMIIFMIVNIGIYYFGRKWHEPDEDEQEQLQESINHF